MTTVLKNYASDAGLALAHRTINMLNAVPQGSRNLAFKELLKRLDPRVAVEVAAARDRGYPIDRALQIGYQGMLERGLRKTGSLSGYRLDWGGLRGYGGLGNQNAPASGGAPASTSSSGGSPASGGSGMPSMDQVSAGIEGLTNIANQARDLIGAVGGAFGALQDAIGGGAAEPAAEPVVIDAARLQTVTRYLGSGGLRIVTPPPAATEAVPYTWSLASLPTWALALGAAVAAGTTFWAVKKYVLKKK